MKDERRPICEVVAESIERLIIDGVLKVGQPLPSERRLCEKLGFSRSALREGLTVLRGRGIIETAQGRDSRVARLNRVQDTSPLIHLFSTQPRTLYDLLDVRALLEGESARLAATLGTQADFVVITRCYEKMLAASENNKEISLIEHAQLDHAFHLAICQASHNQVLVFTLQSLTDLMFNSVFASVNNLYHRPQQKKQIDRQHARIDLFKARHHQQHTFFQRQRATRKPGACTTGHHRYTQAMADSQNRCHLFHLLRQNNQ